MANPMYPSEPNSRLGNAPEGKQSKSSVNYALGGEHCDACIYFIEAEHDEENEPPQVIGECQKVEGRIGGHMWCNLFKWIPGSNDRIS